jgi:hypothetical protein
LEEGKPAGLEANTVVEAPESHAVVAKHGVAAQQLAVHRHGRLVAQAAVEEAERVAEHESVHQQRIGGIVGRRQRRRHLLLPSLGFFLGLCPGALRGAAEFDAQADRGHALARPVGQGAASSVLVLVLVLVHARRRLGNGGAALGVGREVEPGGGAAEVARGVVVGARRGLGGGEGAEPDADAPDGVAHLGRPLAPRPAPHAVVRAAGPPAPGPGEPERLLRNRAHRLFLGVLVEVPERGFEVVVVVGRGPTTLAAATVAWRDAAPRRRAGYELGEDRTAAHVANASSLLARRTVSCDRVNLLGLELAVSSVVLGCDRGQCRGGDYIGVH